MVIWADSLANIADWMGLTALEAGTMMSLILTCCFVMAILIATKGKKAEFTVPVGTLFVTVLFTFMGWYPIWTGSALALILSIFTGWVISRGW